MRSLLTLLISVVVCSLTLHAALDGSHRVVFGSCANPNKGGKIWRLIQSFRPDHLVVLGDVMYADHDAIGRVTEDTPKKIVQQYNLLSQDRHWRSLLQSVKDFSITFDDHDYGGDNGDKTFRYREVGQEAFRNFTSAAFERFHTNSSTAVYSSTTVHTRVGRGESATAFTYKVVLLDGRSNKDPRGTANGDFLGEEQWQWLAEELLDPSVDAILLGSAIQVLAEDQIVEESWNEFPAARRRLLTLVTAASRLTNIVLLSGDVHRAEVSRASCSLLNSSEDGNQWAGAQTRLWELTSSGLSHTIMHRTNDLSGTSREEYIAQDSNDNLQVPIRLRNPAVLLANHIYEFARPAHHREDKRKDVFHGINFGVLDFVPADSSTAGHEGAGAGAVQLELRIVSHEGESVMVKSIPLRSRSQLTHNLSDQEVQALRASLLLMMAQGALDVQCEPYWGAAPLWRTLLYRAVIACALLLLVVAPVLVVLWFVGASLYYVLRGKELARRDAIEHRYQQLKKRA